MTDPNDDDLLLRPETALTRSGPTLPTPAMKMADSLADAAPRTFVHVDGKGRVRSPARYRLLQAVSYGAAAAIVGGVTVMYGALLGVPGVGVGAAFAGYFGWHLQRSRRLQRATVLLVHDRLDEAELLLREVLTSWRCPRHVAALAEQNLAAIYSRRGNFDEALDHQRMAMALYAQTNSKSPMRHVVQYAEIVTLVNLGRVGEARQRLEQLPRPPEGDYLRLQYWGAQLYVCLAEGEHRIDPEPLHDCAITALKITGAAALLGLTAWAHWRLDDHDQARHLLNEAYDRRQGVRLERSLPLLWAWMEAHADAAGVDRSIGAEEHEGGYDPSAAL